MCPRAVLRRVLKKADDMGYKGVAATEFEGFVTDALANVAPLFTADVEVIPIQKVNEAYERLLKSDVKYRFSIDMASLKSE